MKDDKVETKNLGSENNNKKSSEKSKINVLKIFTLINTIATIIIAIATFFYWQTTQDSLKLQGDYYNKTIRPFAYIDSVEIEVKYHDNDTTLDVYYRIENIGSMPGKDILASTVISENFVRDFSFDIEKRTPGLPSIYPRQELRNKSTISGIKISNVREKPYLYFYIEYKDMGDKSYYYKKGIFVNRYCYKSPIGLIKLEGETILEDGN